MSDNKAPLNSQHRWTDHQVELFVGNLLRYGVMTAAAIALLGGIPYLIANGMSSVHFGAFTKGPETLTTVHGIIQGARHFQSRSVIQLGLLCLIATPVARVALSLLAFTKQGDRTYMVVTTIVLVVLIWGFIGGGQN